MTIHHAVQYYKQNIDKYWQDEAYKWIAVKHYRSTWNIEAVDFPAMLENSLSQAYNLLTGAMYYPKKMICILAKMNPERVRELFKRLYNENTALGERIALFRSGCDELLVELRNNVPGNEKAKNHYQDLRAICVYLTFEYPEKYFLYKAQMYSDFKKLVDYSESSSDKDYYTRNFENFSALCQLIVDEAKKDDELLQLQQERIEQNNKCYSDSALHMLAQTIMYVFPNSEKSTNYWPSQEEYPIELTKEDWKRFFDEVEYPYHKGCMRVLKCFLDIGGVASPKKLSEKYKGHATVYTSSVTRTCQRAIKYFGLEPCPENDTVWFFPVAFLGKKGTDADKGTYVYKMRDEVKEALQEMNLKNIELEYEEQADKTETASYSLNTILYGPPGTGKTYNTVIYAVAIVEKRLIEDIREEVSKNYSAVKKRFDMYKDAGRVAFTTFHQSYGYEEFIEGIKPRLEVDEDSDLTYSVEPGVFNAFCDKASAPVQSENQEYGLNKSPIVWKVSLAGTYDNPVREECLKNSHIRIGWDEYGPEITDSMRYDNGGKVVLNAFINKMKVGDIVLSCYSASVIDAIGVVTSDYEWDDSFEKYKRVRKVNWIIKDIKEDILDLNGGVAMTLSTVYQLRISASDVLSLLEKIKGGKNNTKTTPERDNYVFIIDEINRGNISKIFGELITLIEDTKRIGAEEEMTVKLPYSPQKKPFGVPKNVFILGTMNTADRSIALLDTALRRRFNFVEMMPDSSVLDGITISQAGETLVVSKMLETINKRIEYLYDREHTIGHAFFVKLRNNSTLECLADIFANNVIPLLQEYFYEDYEKIQLVLGDNAKSSDEFKFILDNPVKVGDLFKKSSQSLELDLHEKTFAIQKEAFDRIRSYIEITETRKSEDDRE